jgi:thioredoxin-like negative regulator of GroEL
LLGLIGETHRHNAEWESAKLAYEQALAAEPSEIHKVFLCECLIQLNQAENAARLLAETDRDKLQEAEDVDYAFVFAALAIETGERDRLETARSALKSVRVQDLTSGSEETPTF